MLEHNLTEDPCKTMPKIFKTSTLELHDKGCYEVLRTAKGREETWHIRGKTTIDIELETIADSGKTVFTKNQAKKHVNNRVPVKRLEWLPSAMLEAELLKYVQKLNNPEGPSTGGDASSSQTSQTISMPCVANALMITDGSGADNVAFAENLLQRRFSDDSDADRHMEELKKGAMMVDSNQLVPGSKAAELSTQLRQLIDDRLHGLLQPKCKTPETRKHLGEDLSEVLADIKQWLKDAKGSADELGGDHLEEAQTAVEAISELKKTLGTIGPQKFNANLDLAKTKPSRWDQEFKQRVKLWLGSIFSKHTPVDVYCNFLYSIGASQLELGKLPTSDDFFKLSLGYVSSCEPLKSMDASEIDTVQIFALAGLIKTVLQLCHTCNDPQAKRDKVDQLFYSWVCGEKPGDFSTTIMTEVFRECQLHMWRLLLVKPDPETGTMCASVAYYEAKHKEHPFVKAIANNAHTGKVLIDEAVVANSELKNQQQRDNLSSESLNMLKSFSKWLDSHGKKLRNDGAAAMREHPGPGLLAALDSGYDDTTNKYQKIVADSHADITEHKSLMKACLKKLELIFMHVGAALLDQLISAQKENDLDALEKTKQQSMELAASIKLTIGSDFATTFLVTLKGEAANFIHHRTQHVLLDNIFEMLNTIKDAFLFKIDPVAPVTGFDVVGNPDAILATFAAHFEGPDSQHFARLIGSILDQYGIFTSHLGKHVDLFNTLVTSSVKSAIQWIGSALRPFAQEHKQAVVEAFNDSLGLTSALSWEEIAHDKWSETWTAQGDGRQTISAAVAAKVGECAMYDQNQELFQAAASFMKALEPTGEAMLHLTAELARVKASAADALKLTKMVHDNVVEMDDHWNDNERKDIYTSWLGMIFTPLASATAILRRAKKFTRADDATSMAAYNVAETSVVYLAAGIVSIFTTIIHDSAKRIKFPANWDQLVCTFDRNTIQDTFFTDEFAAENFKIAVVGELLKLVSQFVNKDSQSILTNRKAETAQVTAAETLINKLKSISAHVQAFNLVWYEFPQFSLASNQTSKNAFPRTCSR